MIKVNSSKGLDQLILVFTFQFGYFQFDTFSQTFTNDSTKTKCITCATTGDLL